MKLRLSLIDFLNAVPLQWGFLHGSCRDSFTLLSDVPSLCADHLARGQADVGLIPVIEYQRIPGLTVLPGLSIASKREVKSVLFVSRRPIEEVKTIAVDSSSRTSVALLRILLAEHFGNNDARLFEFPLDPVEMLRKHEAALLIGNPALRVQAGDLIVYDLANLWYRFTGLPFVFAFWAVRQGVELGSRRDLFYRSFEEGMEQIDKVSDVYSEKLGLSPPEIRNYLRDNLDYSLDPENRRGLNTFFRMASEKDLIAAPRPIAYYGDIQNTSEKIRVSAR